MLLFLSRTWVTFQMGATPMNLTNVGVKGQLIHKLVRRIEGASVSTLHR